jgi:hypothetical protein
VPSLVPIKKREGGDLRGSVVNRVDVNERFRFYILCGVLVLPIVFDFWI